MIVTASNRTALVATPPGKSPVVVIVPSHEADQCASQLVALGVAQVTPIFCDTAAEALQELDPQAQP